MAFRTALEQRLLARSQSSGLSLPRLRKQVAFDRLLARLIAVAPDRWVLKGGLALDLRLRERARATIDMDLGRRDDESSAMTDFRAAMRVDLGDYFEIMVQRTSLLDLADVAGAVRYRVRALLDMRRFEEFVVDVGFSDAEDLHSELLEGLDLLAFAELPSIHVPTIPLPQHIAEKIHAYTRRYGPEQRWSTRAKDLVDIVLISETSRLVAGDLRIAIGETFGVRANQALPSALTEPPPDWRSKYADLAMAVGIPSSLHEGYLSAARFLDPVLGNAISTEATWDPTAQEWMESAEQVMQFAQGN
jgi:hypothetical protein